jgi:methylglutaconyl-CoA hydratase
MIEVVSEQGVGRITLDRPEIRNALSGALMRSVVDALGRFEGDSSVRAIVVTGRGKAFSAGADLAEMRKAAEGGQDANRRDALELGRMFHRIAAFPKPVVARVNGPAIGGGVGLMAACDVVVAARSAFFQFSEVRLGLVPAVISPFCIARLGAATARRLFLTGERFNADDALRYGLVDVVGDDAALDDAVRTVTDQLLLAGPTALAEAKALISKVVALKPAEALTETAAIIARLRASAEAHDGMTAFLSKSPPPWVAG